ncbi:DUF4136 domain-containing protein [Algoriphagus halophytocola]|uniref:DUF4136 domain-containing protein n=1 Tax=Algoriphagus halophytocola TaxID=2991499 RepID=UPI0022DD88FF|nr:DUF4136 domain-containing protein [Algoriphagus sp. TR-M9]WBL44290.1 DUF4136 domain-containing protein [Algoriphagus sp. TR-M9]
MFKKFQQVALGILGSLVLISCAPDGAEYVDELDIVYTNYAVEYDFAGKSTFAVPDQIVLLKNEFVDGGDDFEPDFVSPAYTASILSSIRENMRNAGYTEVNKDSNPDLIILPTVIQTNQVYFYYDWWYWNWFYPGWGPGWGWYYPGYYPPQVSNVRTGTLLMQMTDPSTVAETSQIPVVWTGVVNGLLEGDINSISNRIGETIDQAFSQSPYISR